MRMLENKWFYMKYIGKYLSVEIHLTSDCIYLKSTNTLNNNQSSIQLFTDTLL